MPAVGVVGLDLSLRRACACYVPSGWEVGAWKQLDFLVVGDEVEGREPRAVAARLVKIEKSIAEFVKRTRARHVFVEDAAFASSQKGIWLGEVAGAVKAGLYDRLGIAAVPVNQSTARKTLLTKLPRKDRGVAVMAALRSAGFPREGSDEGDALTIASHGRSTLGMPALVFPPAL